MLWSMPCRSGFRVWRSLKKKHEEELCKTKSPSRSNQEKWNIPDSTRFRSFAGALQMNGHKGEAGWVGGHNSTPSIQARAVGTRPLGALSSLLLSGRAGRMMDGVQTRWHGRTISKSILHQLLITLLTCLHGGANLRTDFFFGKYSPEFF